MELKFAFTKGLQYFVLKKRIWNTNAIEISTMCLHLWKYFSIKFTEEWVNSNWTRSFFTKFKLQAFVFWGGMIDMSMETIDFEVWTD